MFVRRSQATRLLYHILTGLSTTFFAFFKTFQIVCSEETILRDSSVRITLSNRAVNTFLKFFTKTSTCINKRYHRPFRIHGTFINHLLIQKCKILFCRFFCCFCRSLCIISCPYRSWCSADHCCCTHHCHNFFKISKLFGILLELFHIVSWTGG